MVHCKLCNSVIDKFEFVICKQCEMDEQESLLSGEEFETKVLCV